MLPVPQWIDSPDSVPQGVILAHGRLSAMAESFNPVARAVLRAASA